MQRSLHLGWLQRVRGYRRQLLVQPTAKGARLNQPAWQAMRPQQQPCGGCTLQIASDRSMHAS
eukprot:4130054-Pyramimonas_sp.AAC.1